MNAFVRKEVRLLFSTWVSILALELILPWFWKNPDNAISAVPALLFFGITILSVSSFGREFSQGTFLSLLSQPIERREIWRIKITVLFVGAVLIFAVCYASSALRLHLALADSDSIWRANVVLIRDDFRTAMLGSVAVLLIALTSGLWTTLLLRQITTALWVSVLTPVALLTLIAIVMTQMFASASDAANETVIYCAVGIYFVSTFWLSRRLFYRAQDVGWSGGVITLPEWKWFGATSGAANLPRKRKPIFALLKKEFQLQQVSLIGAAGLFALHLGVIAWRGVHTFEKDSAGEVLTSIFWMLWLIIPVVIGCMAVAEERKLGVMEGQLCLPVSRRLQFIVKGFLVLMVGILLGGAMPIFLESIATTIGVQNQIFKPENHPGQFGVFIFQFSIVALSLWLALVSLFASSLARNFLQAIGYAIVTFVGCVLIYTTPGNGRVIFFNLISAQTILPIVIGVPTIIVTLLWLAYLNFKNFRDGWYLWRRTVLGFAGAFVFVVVMSAALYNRVWEIFEPAEPPHGAARFSLLNPPILRRGSGENFQVRLADGRVWVSYLGNHRYLFERSIWRYWRATFASPLPKAGAQQFVAGSNWVSVATPPQYGDEFAGDQNFRTVGIQTDGSLWLSVESKAGDQTTNQLTQLGNEANWQQISLSPGGILLLKNDGGLWQWEGFQLHQWEKLPAFKLKQVGADSNWKEIFYAWPGYARKANGSVWTINVSKGKQELRQETNLEQIVFGTSSFGNVGVAYVRPDGTLWAGNDDSPPEKQRTKEYRHLQVGKETDWLAVVVSYHMMVALKSNGTLWQWDFQRQSVSEAVNVAPTRLGIHHDWVAITGRWGNVIALAADGSLWLWPDRKMYGHGTLLKFPKQPRLLGNIFSKTD